MKRTQDNGYSASIVGYAPDSTTFLNQAADGISLQTMPEEVVLRIFNYLSESQWRQLSLVNKTIDKYAKHDLLWNNIIKNILFPHEIGLKPENTTCKEFIRDFLSCSKVCKASQGNFHTLKARNPAFVEHVKQMTLPQFKVLSPLESNALFQEKDSIQFIQAVAKHLQGHFSFHHVTQQWLANLRLDCFNCTDLVIFLNPDREVLINGKLTNFFIPTDCQLLIYRQDSYLYIYSSFIGNQEIIPFHCNMEALEKNLHRIKWHASNPIIKERSIEDRAVELWNKISIPPIDSELTPQIVHRVKQMKLPEFNIFNLCEAKALLQKEESIKFIEALYPQEYSTINFTYFAQQQVGVGTFTIFNCCNDNVISFDSAGQLLLNNKLTQFMLPLKEWQLLISPSLNFVNFFYMELGTNVIMHLEGKINADKLKNPQKIKWSEFLFQDFKKT